MFSPVWNTAWTAPDKFKSKSKKGEDTPQLRRGVSVFVENEGRLMRVGCPGRVAWKAGQLWGVSYRPCRASPGAQRQKAPWKKGCDAHSLRWGITRKSVFRTLRAHEVLHQSSQNSLSSIPGEGQKFILWSDESACSGLSKAQGGNGTQKSEDGMK